MSITSHMLPEHKRTLKCLAYDFYPQPISLYWTRAGNVVEAESWGEDVTANGSYQSWVVVKVPSQDRHPYSCHIQHSSLAQPRTVPWNERQEARAEGDSGSAGQ